MPELDGEKLMKDAMRGMENERTHSILYRCFPPRPHRCMVCGAEGEQLWAEPCRGFEGRIDPEFGCA